ncbi:MAG: hypothetical protein FWE12_03530 [Oscillospiraceae bacterium]|nr:hypothetical protein [Oscillospiraceae bacterium]
MELRKLRPADTVFLMTVGVLLAASLVAGILNTTVFYDDHLATLGRMFVIVGALRLIFGFWVLRWGSAIVLILGLGALAYWGREPYHLAYEVIYFIREILLYLGGYLEYRESFEQAIVWTISLTVGVAVVLFGYFLPFFFPLFVVSAWTFGLILISPFFDFYPAFYAFVFCMLAYLVRSSGWRAAPASVGFGGSIYAAGLAAVCLVAASFIPIPRDELFEDVRNPFQAITDAILPDRSPSHFAIRHVGFGGGGALGGNIAPDDRIFLFARTDAPTPFYLTGAIFDIYTGYAWESSEREPRPFGLQAGAVVRDGAISVATRYQLDFFERVTSHATALLIAGEIAHFVVYADEGTELRFLDIAAVGRTYSVFYQGIVQDVFARDPGVRFLRDQHGQITAEARMPGNTLYTVVYRAAVEPTITATLGGPGWIGTAVVEGLVSPMPQASYRGILADAHQLLQDFRENHVSGVGIIPAPYLLYHGAGIFYDELLSNYLIPRAAWIHETYTQLPDGLPERVGELARSLTEGAESDYERARRLEFFLSTQFYYTLTPGASPRDQDFVDHFLFDLQMGYCVHFATSFVVLARSIGLPTRYVEGFLVSGPVEEHGYINVLNNMGHAWAEVYFEGYGWHRFEPTPAGALPEMPTGPGIVDRPPPFPPGWPGDVETGGFPGGALPTPGVVADPPTTTGPGEIVDEAETTVLVIRLWVWIALGLLVILALLGARIFWVSARRARVETLGHREAVRFYFAALVRYRKALGSEIQPDETAERFVARTGGAEDVAEIFARARYSGHEISLVERNRMAEAVREQDAALLASAGSLRYWWYKHVLGIV